MPKKAKEKRPKSKTLAIVLRSEAGKLGLTLRDLEAKTRLNYEHLRRIVLGEAHPSDEELAVICKALNVPAGKMHLLSIEDQIYNTYGVTVTLGEEGKAERFNMAPNLVLIASDWASLTPDQQVSFMVQIRAVAEHNWSEKSKTTRLPHQNPTKFLAAEF